MESGAAGEGGDQIQVGDIQGSKAIAIGRGATAIYQGLSVEEVATLVVELKHKDQPKVWDGRYPYPGLASFQEADAEFFFGRETLVADLLGRLQKSNFVVIAGPSGSGKSSVARAGLFQALRDGRLPKSSHWQLATMQPGGQPIEQLAAAIERLTKLTGTGNHIREHALENPLALHQQIQTLLTADPGQRFVLLVDQFEESFTQTKEESLRAAFIQLLTSTAQTTQSRAIILLALRADFVSHCARYPSLRELMSQQFQLVGAMESPDLAKAITLPALKVGADIDAALVSRIMADMKGEPGALPLMSFALQDLFEAEKTKKGEPMDLTLPEYLHRGGIESALERHANQVFANFSAEEQELAKGIFARLIEVGQGRVDTRRTAVFAELVPAGKDAEKVNRVVDTLAHEGARLLTTSGDHDNEADAPAQQTVTIAHEKLIDAWPWLRQLVDENREVIALQNQIATDALAWAADDDAGYLYRGGRLAQVEEKLAEIEPNLNELSQQFIQASLAARQAERQARAEQIQKEEALRQEQANAGRFRRLTRWLSVAAGVAVVATIVALIFLNQANIARGNSEFNEAQAIAAQATSDVNANNASIAQATSDANADLASTRQVEAVNAQATSDVNAANAIVAQATSEANAALADTREAEARAAQAEIAQLKNAIQASQLAFAAQAELANDPERALLLAVAGLRLSVQPDTHHQLAQNLQERYLTTLYGNDGLVNAAAFSPDGQTFLTANWDGTARLWDRDGSESAVLRGHESLIHSAIFSPDGQTILTASADGTARLWDKSGAELIVLRGHQDQLYSAVFSPDGQTILTASWDGTARLWDRAGKEMVSLSVLEFGSISAVFSPDGQTILIASWDGTAQLWDRDGAELAVLRGHEGEVNSAMFNPDGRTVLTASADGTARLWDASGAELAVLRAHEREVYSAIFSPDGQTILTASADNTARLWDASGAELAILRGHQDVVHSAIFSPDGQTILTASWDGTARLWDRAGTELAVLRGHEGEVSVALFSPDGQTIFTSGCDRYNTTNSECMISSVRLWNEAGAELTVLRGHQDGVRLVAEFSPDGQTILTASQDGTARLWDRRGNELSLLHGHINSIFTAEFSPDGQTILTASEDSTARLWDRRGNELAVLYGEQSLFSAEFSFDGQNIITAGWDGIARLWDRSGTELAALRGHAGVVLSAVFSPDGQTILTASDDGTARLWDRSGTELAVLAGHEGGVFSAVFSPDGETILTGSLDQTARLWDRNGEQLAILHGHEGAIFTAVFSPDGETILTTSEDNTARLWDKESGSVLAVLVSDGNLPYSAVFSPDGQIILVAYHDGTARLWNRSGEELAILHGHQSAVMSAVFSPDGQSILTAGWDGTARLWPNFTVEYMVQEAYWRIQGRGFTEEECQLYFRDDPATCPRTKEELFAPLAAYLSAP